jgi:hypothetical protein
LSVDANDFDDMLAKKMRLKADAMDVDEGRPPSDGDQKEESAEDMITKEQTARLQDLAKKVEKFLDTKGDVGGAQFEE